METLNSWTHPAYEKIAKLMESKTGLLFRSHRFADIETVARKTMARLKVHDEEAFLRLLQMDRNCLDGLIDQLTVGESYFFREPAQFQWIRKKILPEILRLRPKNQPLRAWSAGCSSGEEAYSLAILFEEEGLLNHAPIQATDISRPALLKAAKAVYSPWSLRGREESWTKKYLSQVPEGYRLDPRFHSRVELGYLNLALDPYPRLALSLWEMDLILCRNVMIYFSPETIQKVFRKLIDTLAEGGWLLTGPSDPVFEDNSDCARIETSAGIVYRKNTGLKNRSIFSLPEWGPAAGSSEPRSKADSPRAKPRSAEVLFSAEASKIQSAFEDMDYGQVLELTRSRFDRAESCFFHLKALANLQGTAAAEEAAQGFVRLHPLSSELHFILGVLLMNLGQDRAAVREFRRTLYLDRTLAAAHFALGSVLRRLQDPAGAGRSFENALKLCRELPAEALLRLSDGESPDQLREAAQIQLSLMGV